MRRTFELNSEWDGMDFLAFCHESQEENDMCVIAIDPGDTHIGVSIGLTNPTPDMSCLAYSAEMERIAALELFQDSIDLGWVHTIVLEDFRLRRDKALAQTGSRMLTSQMIGSIDWMVKDHNRMGQSTYIHLVFQQPSILETMKAVCKREGLAPYPGVTSIHARESQLHFWYAALKREGKI